MPQRTSCVAQSRIDGLLATVPDDATTAGSRLCAAAGDLLGHPLVPLVLLVRDAGRWRACSGEPGDVEPGSCPEWAVVRGEVALLDPVTPIPSQERSRLEKACSWIALAVARDRARIRADDAALETSTVTEVVEQLLAMHDVDQLLLSIADRTLALLDADICGVLLREGDEVRMRSCVGHRVVETARLRMRRGQGVAGLVFQTGRPARVDRYDEDPTISRDFVGLASREETRSALAVPLALPGEFLGVLEVWRRRPSTFSEQDVRRMVTLADFATIALRSARAIDSQQQTLDALESAHEALKTQVEILGRTAELQQVLVTRVLDGGGLPGLAACVAQHLDCGVGIYDVDGAQLAGCGRTEVPASIPLGVRGRAPVVGPRARAQAVHAEGEPAGHVVLCGRDEPSTELLDAVVGQVAMACSLAVTRERAATRVREEALDEALWDLLGGPVEHRLAARGRVASLGVVLRSRLRVLHGRLENLEETAAAQGWDTSRTDRCRREVLRAVRGPDGAGLTLSGLRGDTVVAVVADLDPAAAKATATGLVSGIRAVHPELRTSWGASRSYDDVLELPAAFTEAKTALSAAQRLGGGSVFLYEELGVVRLLLGSGSDPDLQTFITDVTGPLVAYDRDNDGSLVRTLRAYFDADCSQRVAAENLFIHHKTMRYRLERIKELTGLDLGRHDDRMRADIALRLLQLNATVPEA